MNPTRARKIRPIIRAMSDPDQWAIRFVYQDRHGARTIRHVSPTSWHGSNYFRGLCLSREDHRLFNLNHVSDVELVPAADLLMPVAIETVETVVKFDQQ